MLVESFLLRQGFSSKLHASGAVFGCGRVVVAKNVVQMLF
jgi:hypothetical protein